MSKHRCQDMMLPAGDTNSGAAGFGLPRWARCTCNSRTNGAGMNAMPLRDHLPCAPVQWHGVGQRAVAVENQTLGIHYSLNC